MSTKNLGSLAITAVLVIAGIAIWESMTEERPKKATPATISAQSGLSNPPAGLCCRADGMLIGPKGEVLANIKVNGVLTPVECDPKLTPCQPSPPSSLCCSSRGTILRARTNGTYKDEGVPCNPNGPEPQPCRSRP